MQGDKFEHFQAMLLFSRGNKIEALLDDDEGHDGRWVNIRVLELNRWELTAVLDQGRGRGRSRYRGVFKRRNAEF